jgi:hypothetical protein
LPMLGRARRRRCAEPDNLDVDDPDRWLAVWREGFRAAYRDVLDFAASRTDLGMVAQLDSALTGRGAFGRFKRVLSEWPDDRAEWLAFADDCSRGRRRARTRRPRPSATTPSALRARSVSICGHVDAAQPGRSDST